MMHAGGWRILIWPLMLKQTNSLHFSLHKNLTSAQVQNGTMQISMLLEGALDVFRTFTVMLLVYPMSLLNNVY